jgi:chromosome segregation ATPase
MNPSRPQSKERDQRSRPPSRVGDLAPAPPRSSSQGSTTRTQSPLGRTSSQRRAAREKKRVEFRELAEKLSDCDPQNLDLHHEIEKLENVVQKYDHHVQNTADQYKEHVEKRGPETAEEVAAKSQSRKEKAQEWREFGAAVDAWETEVEPLFERLDELRKAARERLMKLQKAAQEKAEAADGKSSQTLGR